MSIETPAKRQRTGDASSSLSTKPPRASLTTEQRQSIRHAQSLENGISALQQLDSLRKGKCHLGQIAWSTQNVLATASDSRRAPPTSAGGHVVLQYPAASSSKSTLRPSYLYPGQPIFTTTTPAVGPSQPRNAATTATEPTRYDDPRHISFSPCGYYLCAFFPTKAPARATAMAAQQSLPNASSDSAAVLPNAHGTGAVPSGIPATDASVPSSDPATSLPQNGSVPATTDTSAHRPPSRLCFWSRAETGALNDWKLIQTLSVTSNSSRDSISATSKPDNVLKVNDKGQPVAGNGSRASPSAAGSAGSNVTLTGGVKQVVWLNRRRRIVLNSSSSSSNHYGASPFNRLASRGPSFLPVAPASTDDSGPDQDVALMVFGDRGQVTLLSSRKAERDAAFNALSGSMGDAGSSSTLPPAFFNTILQSTLYEPSLQPSPITLDSTHNQVGQSPEKAANHIENGVEDDTSEQENDAQDRLTHLAVGMPANDSSLLVASKRPSSSSPLIDLTEVNVDLRGDSITMTTRPLPALSLSSADHLSSNDALENDNTSSPVDLDNISILTWAEVDSTSSSEDSEPQNAAGLRLVACSSHVQAPTSVPDSADEGSATSTMRSNIAVWDLHKAENELSDAFASLECRKTGHAPKWLDWQLRFARSKTLTNQLVTSLVADAHGMAVADLAVLTSLTPAQGGSGLLSEKLGFFDLRTVEIVAGGLSPVPARALSRSSQPVVSSNGALIATLSSTHVGAEKGVVMWKLPHYPCKAHAQQSNGTAEVDDETSLRMSQLFALSCLRKSDSSDVSRAFAASASQATPAKLLIDIGDLLKITESKRQDVLVKIEGATQKGPSHDSNSIPFHQALRLLKIRMAIDGGKASTSRTARLERLVLELGLCYQVLRLARVQAEVTVPTQPAAESGKKKSGGAAKAAAATTNVETRERVYYRLESVWPLLAQLQWFLTLLDGVSRLALATSSFEANADATTRDTFELDLVQMLNKPTPQRLVLQILAHFCDFQEWILSTTKKENLPPATPVTAADDGFFASNGAVEGTMLAVSEQMGLARDSLRKVVGDASMDLGEFAGVLVKVEGELGGMGRERESDRFWWASLEGSEGVKMDGFKEKLLSSIGESGALVDVLTLFLSPQDLADERGVLYEKGKLDNSLVDQDGSSLTRALSAMSAKRSVDGDQRRDVVRKVSLQTAVTQARLHNDAATLLRTHPTTAVRASSSAAASRLQPALGDSGPESESIKVSLMRAKRCVRCHALSQDPISATYSIHPPAATVNPAAGLVDPNLPPHIQMQMQMQMMQMMQMMQQQQQQQGGVQNGAVPPALMQMLQPQPQPKLVGVEVRSERGSGAMTDRFRFGCLCGGGWWVL